VLLAVGAAHGAPPDLSQFVGTWMFTDGNTGIQCGGSQPLSTPLAARASLYMGTDSDLTFELGCNCRIPLTFTSSGAASTGPQTCTIVNEAVKIQGQVDRLELDLSDGGTLTFTLVGSGAAFTLGGIVCTNAPFSGTGHLTRVDTGYVSCGEPATAVGVVTYTPSGSGNCLFGTGREGFQIQMHDEDTGACSDQTGSAGEGPWSLPDDGRPRVPNCSLHRNQTTLNFCRVDGTRFRPMTGANDPSQFFAVLKLGTDCPNGSIEISKVIDNEDDANGAPSGVLGDPGPNIVTTAPTAGTLTTLVFCYFRAAASPDQTMSAFPDLGFPYAVFHSYLDEQPPWVIAKRWQYSLDENGRNNKDAYLGSDPALKDEFTHIIENAVGGQYSTYFDVARVR
jgi:hypothetical protein